MSWYDALRDLVFNRYPLKVSIGSEGIERPTVVVDVINQTPNYSAVVHSVRVHYGNFYFSRAFNLEPHSKVILGAKDKEKWVLSFDQVKITERTRTKKPDSKPFDKDSQPGINSPAQLFNAIGMGSPKDSWIEIDFNEYVGRSFLKGKVKEVFDVIGKTHQALRKNSA